MVVFMVLRRVAAMLLLDETYLMRRYGGILLCVARKDDNEGIFHLAFVIVDNETNENWMWFVSTLGDALYVDEDYEKITTFFSYQSKELVNVITKVFSFLFAYLLFTTSSCKFPQDQRPAGKSDKR